MKSLELEAADTISAPTKFSYPQGDSPNFGKPMRGIERKDAQARRSLWCLEFPPHRVLFQLPSIRELEET